MRLRLLLPLLLARADNPFRDAPCFISVGGARAKPNALAVGDFDGDGLDDVAVGGYDSVVSWYRSNGTGFDAHVAVHARTGLLVKTLHAADLDGDGDVDLLSGANVRAARARRARAFLNSERALRARAARRRFRSARSERLREPPFLSTGLRAVPRVSRARSGAQSAVPRRPRARALQPRRPRRRVANGHPRAGVCLKERERARARDTARETERNRRERRSETEKGRAPSFLSETHHLSLARPSPARARLRRG